MEDKPLVDWAWIGQHLDDVVVRLLQHIELTAIPVALGFAISLGLAIWAVRRPVVFGPTTALTGVLYTVPSIAAFAFLRPIFGLSLLTAIIPLTTYTLLILFRSNVAGLQSISAEVLEAAEGMGYTPRERLRHVEIPLAVPLLITGIRLASVTTVGLATVAAILGDSFGGLGQFITEGLQTFFPTKIYLGAVLSVALAFSLDVLFVRIERWATPWARARAATV
jgi:osmoprotectant transport system permease protein